MKINFELVIHLLHSAAFGSLATQSVQMPGYPFASILPYVLDEQHRPVFLISGLAEHTKNLIANGRASFLVHGFDQVDVLASERISIMGDVTRVDVQPEFVSRFLRYQPDAERYLGLGDFAFFKLSPKNARYVGGFGRMGWLGGTEWADATVLHSAGEERIIQDVLEVPPVGVRLLGLDCYGFDVERAGMRERHRFLNGPLSGPISAEKIAEAVRRSLSTM